MSVFLFLAILAVASGLGSLWPNPTGRSGAWLGPRLCAGFAVLCAGLYLAGLAGVPLHVAAWTLTVAGSLLLAVSLVRLLQGGFEPAIACHPVIGLAALLTTVIAWHGSVTYLPHTYDEWANWLGWSRQMIAADQILNHAMVISTRGEMPGWPLLMAFPGLLQGTWSEGDAMLVMVGLHIGLLAVTYDVLVWFGETRLGMPRRTAILIGWAWIGLSLAAELSWRLVPLSLLIEEPQVYVLGVVLLLFLPGLEPATDRVRLSAAIGLVAALAYLFKHASIVFLPSYGLLALGLVVAELRSGRDRQPAARAVTLGRITAILLALLLPVAVIIETWALFDTWARCQASLLVMLQAGLSGAPVHGEALPDFAGRVAAGLWSFAAGWKLPVSAVAAIGLVAALCSRRYWLFTIGLAGYAAALLFGYGANAIVCFTPYEAETLASLARYRRVPFRIIHIFGWVGLAILVLTWLRGRARWFGPAIGRTATAALALFVIAALAWQIRQAGRSLVEIAQRTVQEPEEIAHIRQVGRDAAALRVIAAERGLPRSTVSVIAQGRPGNEKPLVAYEGMGRRRGDPPAAWSVDATHAWSPVPAGPFATAESDREAVRAALLGSDIVVPIKTDPWIREILAPLVPPACAADPEAHYLFRQPSALAFDCVQKPRPRS